MKKIGLIGGTGPESTLVYYRELNKRINKRMNGTAFPEIIIESVDLFKALRLVGENKLDELTDYIACRLNNLEHAGADVIALTAATMHVVYDQLATRVNTPFISIPQVAAQYAQQKGYAKVALLGTIFTMQRDYLSRDFIKRGIQVITPTPDEQKIINQRITDELEFGIVKPETQRLLVDVIQRMKDQENIQAVILGCTELPLALNNDISPVDCIDIMDIHIDYLANTFPLD